MEQATYFLKPATPGLVVPKPEDIRQRLAAEGEWVTKSTYWNRRLRDGSVVTSTPPEEE